MLSAQQHARPWPTAALGGVGGFYLGALSFVEYLMALRGQGGMNDLLQAMARPGNVDEAFRQVYGQDYPAHAAGLARARSASSTAADAARARDARPQRTVRSNGRRAIGPVAARWPAPSAAATAGPRGRARVHRLVLLALQIVSRKPLRSGRTTRRDVLVLGDLAPSPWRRRRPSSRPPRRSTRPLREGLGAGPDAALGDGVDLLVGLLAAPPPPCGRSPRRRPRSGSRTFARSSSVQGRYSVKSVGVGAARQDLLA